MLILFQEQAIYEKSLKMVKCFTWVNWCFITMWAFHFNTKVRDNIHWQSLHTFKNKGCLDHSKNEKGWDGFLGDNYLKSPYNISILCRCFSPYGILIKENKYTIENCTNFNSYFGLVHVYSKR